MKRHKGILITGGAGFIGSHLVDRLLGEGYQVSVLDNLVNGSLDNLKEAAKEKNFRFIEGDILNRKDCLDALEGIDAVYHLACLGVRHSIHSPFENHRVNAEGTLVLLEACRERNIEKFIYFSTSEIYGDVRSFPINEKKLPNPLTVYGASKLVGEYYTNVYKGCYGLDTSVIRVFNNYGPRAHYEGDCGELIPRTIVKLLYGHAPVIFGDGSITRDFYYVKDTAAAVAGLLQLERLDGEILNIGAGREYSIKEVIEEILKVMKTEDIKPEYLEDRPADVPRLWVDASRFREITGYEAEFNFTQGLEETVKYYVNLAEEKNLLGDIRDRNWEKQ